MEIQIFMLFQLLLSDYERKVKGFENVAKALSEEVDRQRLVSKKANRRKIRSVKTFAKAA